MKHTSEQLRSQLRELPSVDSVCTQLSHLGIPAKLLVREVRRELADRREQLRNGQPTEATVAEAVEGQIRKLITPSLRPVINATGVVLHTNLGRAPLTDFTPIPRYSNLEYDLATGKRGKRDVHTADLLQALLERAAIVVNNNAAAVFLVLHELAAGHEVIVSRGELIEIGDGFRIPEIMARSGAILREVGTTNKTNLGDYAGAITDRTKLILRVHPSNFRVTGFTARPELSELAKLGQSRGVPVFEDLGSGCVVDLTACGIHEPLVSESFEAGVNVACFSCDKLLGGPQSGIIAGDADLIARIRRNPLYRALRVDKLIIEALEQTLRCLLTERWSAIPTLQAITTTDDELRARAIFISGQLAGSSVRRSESPIGGGSTPDQTLPTWVVCIPLEHPQQIHAALRSVSPPVIARIEDDELVLDMRTVAESEMQQLIGAVKMVLGTGSR